VSHHPRRSLLPWPATADSLAASRTPRHNRLPRQATAAAAARGTMAVGFRRNETANRYD
jgi:hypothetical protein